MISILLAAAAINIDNGRQLFVDDHLVESKTGIERYWNKPTKVDGPIVRPTSRNGARMGGCAVATDGGLWWDPTIAKFRLWFEDDWAGCLRYAESGDGMKWDFPDLKKVKGTSRVFPDSEEKRNRDMDSWSVWPDYKAANPYANWKMLVSVPGGTSEDRMFTSPNGTDWTKIGLAGWSGDRTTMHFDAILDKWVFSLRDYRKGPGRSRRFHVQDAFVPDAVPYGWKRPDRLAKNAPLPAMKEPEIWPELDLDYGKTAQGIKNSLYNFDAVPYESLMLGVFEVLHNTPHDNGDSEAKGLPKQTTLRFGFSRDGRTYLPAPEEALRPEGWGSGKWDTGYLSAMGGVCVIRDEKLWFYYSALRGDAEKRRAVVGNQPMYNQGIYYNGAIGAATLRRDGFCGLVADGKAELVTKPLAFTGGHLFVNAECLYGEVKAEIIDADGKPFPGFAAADCEEIKFDDITKRELVFKGGSLAGLGKKEARIRFLMHCATLYSFWVSPSRHGESRGYVAAGGPAYGGLKDDGAYVRRPMPFHAHRLRRHEGIPSIAVSKKNGRMWATWYGGPTRGEDRNCFQMLSTSADGGKTWKQVYVADPDLGGMDRTFDGELWIAPDGRLRWTWTQRTCELAPSHNDFSRDYGGHGGYSETDRLMMVELDAENEPTAPYLKPRCIADGVMMCKPTVLRDGTWLLPVARWQQAPSACFFASTDNGKTFSFRGGATIPAKARLFDEHTIVERANGDLYTVIRGNWTGKGSHPWCSVSHDGGRTWEEAGAPPFQHTSSRLYMTKLASGNMLLVKNGPLDKDCGRSQMTAFLSKDGGTTWEGGLLLDERAGVSYPDGDQKADGTIVVVYDHDRMGDREVLFAEFTEADVLAGGNASGKVTLRNRISHR